MKQWKDLTDKNKKWLAGGLTALVLFGTGLTVFVTAPELAGTPVRTNAAYQSEFVPGRYTARMDVSILNKPAADASRVGKVRQGHTVTVHEIERDGDHWYGEIGREGAGTWVLLQNGRTTHFVSAAD